MSEFVGVDPRAVGFILGKQHSNIKDIAADVLDKTNSTVFIKWCPPDIYWGSFKITSSNKHSIRMARHRIRDLEKEFVHKVEDGILPYPKLNRKRH